MIAVLQGEDAEEFAEYREQMLEELGANGTLEVVLAERQSCETKPIAAGSEASPIPCGAGI